MKSKDKLITVVEKIAKAENKSPDTVVAELNNMSEEQINNKLKMINIFKEGGKLDYLLCLKKGGSVKDCGCGGSVEKAQKGRMLENATLKSLEYKGKDTIARGVTDRGAEFIAKGTPEGRSLETIIDTGSTGPISKRYYENQSLLQKIFDHKLNKQNRDDVGIILQGQIPMHQSGDKLRRRDARENAAENRGMNRRQFRQAYRNAKNSLRENGPEGLRGRDLRQAARHAFDPWNTGSGAIQPAISVVPQTSARPEIARPNDSVTRTPVRINQPSLNLTELTYRDPEIAMPALNIVAPNPNAKGNAVQYNPFDDQHSFHPDEIENYNNMYNTTAPSETPWRNNADFRRSRISLARFLPSEGPTKTVR